MDEIGLGIISLFGSKEPIEAYYKSMPCMFGEVVGRIVGESEDGSWDVINGVEMFSTPLFATPHGTVIKIGIMRLNKITEKGLEDLDEYEKQVINSGNMLYAGLLD